THDTTPTHTTDNTSWPPTDAQPINVDHLYEHFGAVGLNYGPAFQGLHTAWRHDMTIYAEVKLDDQAAAFGIDPALLDATFHALGEFLTDGNGPLLPFAFTGVRLHTTGVTALRVTLQVNSPQNMRLTAAAEDGTPVFAIDEIALRRLDPTALATADIAQEALFGLQWEEIAVSSPSGEEYSNFPSFATAIENEMVSPKFVIARLSKEAGHRADAARVGVHAALSLLRAWFAA
ncbi:hypothetical protein BST28_22950, partial [Mycolicibacter kumamotonensis]